MVDLKENNFFEEDDEFFADAFRSLSELETSSSLKQAEESNSRKQKDDELFSPNNKILPKNSHSRLSGSTNNNDLCVTNNSPKLNNSHDISPNAEISKLDERCSINHRFLSGYTPKAIKRKFAGPAGILTDEPPRKLSIGKGDVSHNYEDSEMEPELIKSSQFSVEELLETVSWKKLQEDVSSNHKLLSNAKHFCVQRVLNDTSKKKLPKHVVVPILCLYIKKFNFEDPISVYMDDTGEISGKVDKEVIELYRNYIKAGTSLILKKITFVCNIMLLEKSNLVSVYLDDGTAHHIQNWNAITEEEPSNSLSCIFPVTPKVLENSVRLKNLNSTPSMRLENNHSTEPSPNSRTLLQNNKTCTDFKPWFKQPQLQHTENTNDSKSLFSNRNNHLNALNIETSFEQNDVEMDDFDELLGNLDEKSFMDDF